LVGSGGANDIASAAAEVVVLATCERRRLVDAVAHVTSPGHHVSCIVTDRCAFERAASSGKKWRLTDIVTSEGESVTAALEYVRAACSWDFRVRDELRVLETEARRKAS
jgi:acyl CoA:acetate/3-ketoacid CoA transferase beta subunit